MAKRFPGTTTNVSRKGRLGWGRRELGLFEKPLHLRHENQRGGSFERSKVVRAFASL